MLKPALLVGPFLGVLGGLLVLLLALFGSGGAGAGAVAIVAMIVGLILGLVIATPLAFVSGALMLRAAAANPRWMRRRAWAAAGFAVGGIAGVIIGWLAGYAEGFLVTTALIAFLGLVGALLCRRMLNASVAALDDVDADIFS